MAKTTVVTKKRRGPAPTGKGVQIGERWHDAELAAIDKWIASNGEMTRGQAIRRLVKIGLNQISNDIKKWTPEEDERLLDLKARGTTLMSIAKTLDRTGPSVDSRIRELWRRNGKRAASDLPKNPLPLGRGRRSRATKVAP